MNKKMKFGIISWATFIVALFFTSSVAIVGVILKSIFSSLGL